MGEHFSALGRAQAEAAAATAAAKPASAAAAPGMTAASTRRLDGGSSSGGGGGGGGGGKASAPAAAAAAPPKKMTPSGIVGMGDSGPTTREIVEGARGGRYATADDDVREVLANPALVEILRDPAMQRVLEECRVDGSKLPKYMAIPEVRRRLLILQKAGLIRVEM